MLGRWLAPLDPLLSGPLLSPEARGRLEATAASLPFALGLPRFALERRLEGPPAVDLLVCAHPGNGGPRLLGRVPGMEALAARWGEGLPLDHVWLDYDVCGAGPPRPNVLMGLADPSRLAEALGCLGVGREGLRGLEEAQGQAVLRHAGVMAARQGSPLRLSLEVQAAHLGALLGRLGLEGLGAEEALQDLGVQAPAFLVDLDLDERGRVLPRLGLEVRPLKGGRGLLERLLSRGACTPEAREAVLGWPGHLTVAQAPEAWPEPLRACTRLALGDALAVLVRRWALAKLTFEPGAPLRAKAYLFVEHRWRSL